MLDKASEANQQIDTVNKAVEDEKKRLEVRLKESMESKDELKLKLRTLEQSLAASKVSDQELEELRKKSDIDRDNNNRRVRQMSARKMPVTEPQNHTRLRVPIYQALYAGLAWLCSVAGNGIAGAHTVSPHA